MTAPVVLHVDGLCMSLTLGCSTFLDLSETYAQSHNVAGSKNNPGIVVDDELCPNVSFEAKPSSTLNEYLLTDLFEQSV